MTVIVSAMCVVMTTRALAMLVCMLVIMSLITMAVVIVLALVRAGALMGHSFTIWTNGCGFHRFIFRVTLSEAPAIRLPIIHNRRPLYRREDDTMDAGVLHVQPGWHSEQIHIMAGKLHTGRAMVM
jgi:hypothetical protein